MTTRREAADGFYRHLREWFTAFLPRQRGAAENTITSCRQTWNMLQGYAAEHHHVAVEKVTFTMIDRATVTRFRNQRLACIRSFFTYAAAAEPTLAVSRRSHGPHSLRGALAVAMLQADTPRRWSRRCWITPLPVQLPRH